MAPLRRLRDRVRDSHLMQKVTEKFEKRLHDYDGGNNTSAPSLDAHNTTPASESSRPPGTATPSPGAREKASKPPQRTMASHYSMAAGPSDGTPYNPIDLTATPDSPINLTGSPSPPPRYRWSSRSPAHLEETPSGRFNAQRSSKDHYMDIDGIMGYLGHAERPNSADQLALDALASMATAERDLREIGKNLGMYICSKCRQAGTVQPSRVHADVIEVPSKKGVLGPWLTCRHCGTRNCPSCGTTEMEHAARGVQPTQFGKMLTVSWCCSGAVNFLIWHVCCGIAPSQEAQQPKQEPRRSTRIRAALRNVVPGSDQPAATSSSKAEPPKAPSPASFLATPAGVGYGMDAVMGNALSLVASKTPALVGPPAKREQKKAATPKSSEEDKLCEPIFRALALLIRCANPDELYGDEPHRPETLRTFFARSPLLAKTAEVLRNSCVDDMMQRSSLYEALLELLEALSHHPTLASVVADCGTLYPSEQQLLPYTIKLAKGTPDASGAASKPQSLERTEPLAAVVDKNAALFRHVVSDAQRHPAEFKGASERRLLNICRRFAGLVEFFDSSGINARAAEESQPSDPSGQDCGRRGAAEGQEARDLARWHRENCVAEAPDEELLSDFHYGAQAAAVTESPLGRLKRVIVDVNSLRPSLPEGIFVRHGSSRLDVVKVLIAGPRETPYEGGLFEFDMFFPADFPTSPPMMHFRTTGGGRVRFNPNLYHNGYVCLSLLNTWSGERWNPKKSTILQVLVSMQAMVFCAEPYYNEPGYEQWGNKSSSNEYNQVVHGNVIEYAMVDWLSKLPVETAGSSSSSNSNSGSGSGDKKVQKAAAAAPAADVWEDVVRAHFRAHGAAILRAVAGWKGKRKVPELTKLLKTHGFVT